MKLYLCLLGGIHDVPGNRRHGESVIAESSDAALGYAIERYGLRDVPPGSTAIAVSTPTLGRDGGES